MKNNIAAIRRVKDAEVILLPKNSNEEGATAWLQANGFDVPDFPGRSVHRAKRRPDL
jgi:hypothetical protein